MGFYEKAPVTYVREACSREEYAMDNFIGLILITLLLSFTLPPANSEAKTRKRFTINAKNT
ncbi:hypothetical protein AAHB56_04475 [Bacillus thuringiensis]